MIHLRLQFLLICLAVLAGCRPPACRVSGCCSSCPKGIFAHSRGCLFPHLAGDISVVKPPPDANLPPTHFPETFVASIGSSRAKFFPLPTQPVFSTSETSRASESDGDSSPTAPEVIPTPPSLPPEDQKQTGSLSPPIWIYDGNRWQPTADGDRMPDRQFRGERRSSDASSSKLADSSWLFRTPHQINASASTDADPQVVLPRTISSAATPVRQTATVRR